MWKSTVLILAASFAVSSGVAQSGGARRPSKRPPALPHESLESMSGPTRVTGEGATTPSGLTFWDIKVGEGAAVTKGKAVKIHYPGWLESGRKFDSSVDAGRPVIFIPGAGQVIKGWEEGVWE